MRIITVVLLFLASPVTAWDYQAEQARQQREEIIEQNQRIIEQQNRQRREDQWRDFERRLETQQQNQRSYELERKLRRQDPIVIPVIPIE